MIKQYRIMLAAQEGQKAKLVQSDAYFLYGALLQKLSATAADYMHTAEEPLLTQYLTPLCGGEKAVWTVSLLSKEKCEEAASILEDCNEYALVAREANFRVEERKSIAVNTLEELLSVPGSDRDCSRFHLRFVSPAAFRVDGEYQFFPTVKHIVSSLASRWNASFPAAQVQDEDAEAALEKHVRITGYDLKSSYYRLKGNSIAAFTGNITLSARLSPPLLQLLRGLLSFGVFSGVGIKTTLGMGGITLKESPAIR